jgi:hypothetical protein
MRIAFLRIPASFAPARRSRRPSPVRICFVLGIAGGVPLRNTGIVPASTPRSDETSVVLKKRGSKSVGPGHRLRVDAGRSES